MGEARKKGKKDDLYWFKFSALDLMSSGLIFEELAVIGMYGKAALACVQKNGTVSVDDFLRINKHEKEFRRLEELKIVTINEGYFSMEVLDSLFEERKAASDKGRDAALKQHDHKNYDTFYDQLMQSKHFINEATACTIFASKSGYDISESIIAEKLNDRLAKEYDRGDKIPFFNEFKNMINEMKREKGVLNKLQINE